MIISAAERLNSVQEYYFSKKLKEVQLLNQQGKNIINLGIGSPDLPPSDATIKALTETAQNEKSHGYQSYIGIPELRSSISKWLNKTYQVQLSPENQILPLIGSKEGIMHISLAFLNKGDKVLLPNPGYPTYASVSNLVEANIEYYELDENNGWNINLEDLKKKNLDDIKILWINFPNMPTGASPNPELIQELILLAKKHHFLIINDNPYSLILNNEPFSIFQLNGAKDVALELNSLSKSHNMAGWRVGWVAGREDYIQTILKVKSNMDSGMFLGIQKAAVAAFENSLEWHQKQNDIYAERKKYVLEIFDLLKLKYDKNSSGLFVWGKVPDDVQNTETLVDEILYQANVFITPGFIFGSKGVRYIRASLCGKVEDIKEALKRITNYLNSK